jgi:hypothetical protein
LAPDRGHLALEAPIGLLASSLWREMGRFPFQVPSGKAPFSAVLGACLR